MKYALLQGLAAEHQAPRKQCHACPCLQPILEFQAFDGGRASQDIKPACHICGSKGTRQAGANLE